MTLNEIAYSLLEIYKGGKLSDDYTPNINHMKFMIIYYRALLVRRDLNKNTFKSPTLLQPLGCQKLIKVDAAECCEINLGCTVVRTENKMPEPIRLVDGDALQIFGLDGYTEITPIKPDFVNHMSGLKFTKNKIKYYRRNGYYYFVGGPEVETLKYVRPFIIAADPIKASRAVECDDFPCLSDSDEFPMPMDMVQNLTQALLNGELKFMGVMPDDIVNDAQDNKEIQ